MAIERLKGDNLSIIREKYSTLPCYLTYLGMHVKK